MESSKGVEENTLKISHDLQYHKEIFALFYFYVCFVFACLFGYKNAKDFRLFEVNMFHYT